MSEDRGSSGSGVGLDQSALQADLTKLDATPTPHDQKVELGVLWCLGGVILLSFLLQCVAFYNGKNDKMSDFASTSGNTALGALVAVLARRSRGS